MGAIAAADVLPRPRLNWKRLLGLIPIGVLLMLMAMIRPLTQSPQGGNELLSWTASSGATGYKVYWSGVDSPGPSYPNNQDVGNVTEASPSGFDPGDPARVAAYDSSGIVGPYSTEINTPSCDQTLSPGANIATAVSGAANNSVICLNSGNYGTVTLNDIARSGFVTLRSVSGLGAQMSPQIGNTDFIRFVSMTLTDVHVNNCSTHIHFVSFDMVDGAPGIEFRGTGSCADGQDLLVYGGDFRGTEQGGDDLEGNLSTESDVDDLKIQFSQFGSNNYGDGVQIGGGTNIEIGPGNDFDTISQAFCDANGGAHCDAIQFFANPSAMSVRVFGNICRNTDTCIMAPDDCGNVTIDNNIFDGTGVSYEYKIQISCSVGTNLFEHNTLRDVAVAFDTKESAGTGASWTARSNIWSGPQGFSYKTSNGQGCDGCVFTHNQGISNTVQTGCTGCTLNNNSVTAPTYSGGSHPSTWAGWQLSSGSAGEGNSHDSKNRGTLYINPSAPANFQET